MAHAVQAPSPTLIEPVTEVLHGVEITDPYRWLEDQNSPRTRKWLDEQTVYTRAYFAAIPDQQATGVPGIPLGDADPRCAAPLAGVSWFWG